MELISHRGNRRDYSENTFDAFRSALSLGADGFECDVQMDVGGNPVIVHDYFHPPREYPLLTDMLTEFRGKAVLEIEIKPFRPTELSRIVDVLAPYDAPDLEITTSIHPVIPYLRNALPAIRIGAIFFDHALQPWMTDAFITDYFASQLALTGATDIHVPPSFTYGRTVRDLKSLGYRVHHFLKTDDPAAYRRLSDMGVDSAVFDDIGLLARVGRTRPE